MNVFISHSFEDQRYAAELAKSLSSHGVSAFSASDVVAGEDMAKAVEKALRKSDATVFLMGPQNSQNPNLYFELGAAFSLGKLILPVITEEMKGRPLPMPLMAQQFIVRRSPAATAGVIADALHMHPKALAS